MTANDFLGGSGASGVHASDTDAWAAKPSQFAHPHQGMAEAQLESPTPSRRGFALAENQISYPTIDPAIVEAARALGVDVQAVCTSALREATSEAKAKRWSEENRAQLDAWNDWVRENGLPLEKHRTW